MDHRDISGRIELRVGVGLGRGAMGRPTRVTDPGGAVQRFLVRPLLEIPQLALGAQDSNAVGAHDGHPGGVIAAVLESAQAIENDGHDLV